MKKTIPFKKEINFDTNLAEIISVSLEHNLKKESEYIIKGLFIVEGEYKINESSINIDPFKYDLPFEINIDEKYNTEKITIDISDFYYEVLNNKTLLVNIEVAIDELEEKEPRCIEEEQKCIEEEKIKGIEKENLFSNLQITESYKTYKIYIMREYDTVESVMEKYQITKEKLSEYNDLNDITVGTKLVIPTNETNS